MTNKIRLLPLTIIIMSMVLGIKIVDFSFGIASIAEASEPEQAAQATDADQKKSETEGVKPPENVVESVAEKVEPLQISSIPTRKEIEYLQKLSQRREELNRRSQELDDRENLLEAVELRIVERTNSLKKIKETIEGLLKQHDEREKAQLASLVKIYSAMKAKEAAKIFDNLDEEVLIAIVKNMKEKQMGAILAKMNLDKAKKLTISLATRTKLPPIEG